MANKITTIFDADTKGFSKGVKSIKQEIKETDGAFKKLKVGAKASFDSFKSSNTQQAAAIAGIGAAAYKSIGLASDLEESVNAVEVTFGDAAEAVLAIGDNSATAFGLSKAEFNSMAVSMSSFAKSAAGEGGDVAGAVEEMATRIADFASVMNLDLAEATTTFQSALAGQTEPIRKYGKDVSAAAVELYALENGLAASKSEMTESIKVQARWGLLMEQTEDTAGDFAATSDGLANSQRILKAEATDLAAGLGEDLMPALTAVIQGMRSLVTVSEALHLDDALSVLGDLGPEAEDFGQQIRGAFDSTARANFDLAREFERSEQVIADFDKTLLDNVGSFDEARQVALDNTKGMEGWVDTQHVANAVALKWADAQDDATDAVEAHSDSVVGGTGHLSDLERQARKTKTVLTTKRKPTRMPPKLPRNTPKP